MLNYYRFSEHNNFENETWFFYIKMTEEQHKKLKQLIKNHISYTLDDKKYNINEIASLIENTKTGYMPFHQYIGILTHLPTKLEFFEVDVFYKGDIQKYCYKI